MGGLGCLFRVYVHLLDQNHQLSPLLLTATPRDHV